MTLSNRGFRYAKNNFQHGRVSDEHAESTGNRKTFDEVRVPPDNIGNKLEDASFELANDGMGNSYEEEPTHLRSGILACLNQAAIKTQRRSVVKVSPPKVSPAWDPEEYFGRLKADFAKLLNTKTGLAFSFSMKQSDSSSWDNANKELEEIDDLISELLDANSIDAETNLEIYQTSAHRFAVFFIKPKESESTKNKELIAALRQVISEYTNQHVKSQINIFLVLANAQAVIEEHLYKIGAKKVEGEA